MPVCQRDEKKERAMTNTSKALRILLVYLIDVTSSVSGGTPVCREKKCLELELHYIVILHVFNKTQGELLSVIVV